LATERSTSVDWLDSVLGEAYDDLTPKQQVVARYLLGRPTLAPWMTAEDVAAEVGVDPATVVRFVQRLGFSGFRDFRTSLRHAILSRLNAEEKLAVSLRNPRGSVVEDSIRQDLRNLESLLEDPGLEAIDRVADRIIAARRTLAVATGSYAALATILSQGCRWVGLTVDYELTSGGELAHRLAVLGGQDLLIGIGFWRAIKVQTEALRWAREKGIPTVAITDTRLSPLARVADEVLLAPSESASFFQSLVAPISLTYALVALVTDKYTTKESVRERGWMLGELYNRLHVTYEPRDTP